MMTRSVGSLCTLLLAWLCALGPVPARQPSARPFVVRSAVELARRDLADAPPLVARVIGARTAPVRVVERDAAPVISWLVAASAPPVRGATRATRTTLLRQTAEHANRPRWRPYDAAAPPMPSRIAR